MRRVDLANRANRLRTSPKFTTGVNISSTRVFDQIRDPDIMGGSPGELSEELVTYEKWKKGWRMNCDVCEKRKGWRMNCDVSKATEGLENELWRRWIDGKVGEWALLIHLRHNSFSNPSVALPTSQLILQPFFHFSYVTSSSLNSPGEPPMPKIPITLRPLGRHRLK